MKARSPIPSFTCTVEGRTKSADRSGSIFGETKTLSFEFDPSQPASGTLYNACLTVDDDIDHTTLDRFPLPPCHVPFSRSHSVYPFNRPLSLDSSPVTTPPPAWNAWKNSQFCETEEEDDDAQTIIAVTPSSIGSTWSDMWSSVSRTGSRSDTDFSPPVKIPLSRTDHRRKLA